MIFSGFFDNCYTKCSKFGIKIFIFLTLNKLYTSRSFPFCFYKKYFRYVTLWSTVSLAWLGVVDKLPFPLHPSVCFVTLSQFHFRSHSCGFRLRLSWDFLKYGCLRPKWTSNYLSIWSLHLKAFHFYWKVRLWLYTTPEPTTVEQRLANIWFILPLISCFKSRS